MEKISINCPSCGGSVQLDDTREFGFCEFCGSKIMYREEAQRLKIEGQIKVAGISDADKLYEDAQMFLVAPMDIKQAESCFQKMTEQFPRDYRGWMGLVKIDSYSYISFSMGTNVKSILESMINHYEYARKTADDKNRVKIKTDWETDVDRLCGNFVNDLENVIKHYPRDSEQNALALRTKFKSLCPKEYLDLTDPSIKERYEECALAIEQIILEAKENERLRQIAENLEKERLKRQQAKRKLLRMVSNAVFAVMSAGFVWWFFNSSNAFIPLRPETTLEGIKEILIMFTPLLIYSPVTFSVAGFIGKGVSADWVAFSYIVSLIMAAVLFRNAIVSGIGFFTALISCAVLVVIPIAINYFLARLMVKVLPKPKK